MGFCIPSAEWKKKRERESLSERERERESEIERLLDLCSHVDHLRGASPEWLHLPSEFGS